MNGRAVVTVVGKDEIGILARAATACADANANILEVTQSVMDDLFTMIMIIDMAAVTITVEELQQSIASSVPTMEVRVMHENIFSSMHTI